MGEAATLGTGGENRTYSHSSGNPECRQAAISQPAQADRPNLRDRPKAPFRLTQTRGKLISRLLTCGTLLRGFTRFPQMRSHGRQFLYSIKKEGESRIFQAQDRAIDDFTLKGKPRNGSIDKSVRMKLPRL